MSWKSGFTENDNLGFAANLNVIILYNFSKHLNMTSLLEQKREKTLFI